MILIFRYVGISESEEKYYYNSEIMTLTNPSLTSIYMGTLEDCIEEISLDLGFKREDGGEDIEILFDEYAILIYGLFVYKIWKSKVGKLFVAGVPANYPVVGTSLSTVISLITDEE